MPKFRRRKLPEPLVAQLVKRVRQREITTGHLQEFSDWLATEPTVPDGDWFKRFQGFTICGEGELVKTFLAAGHLPHGIEVYWNFPWMPGNRLSAKTEITNVLISFIAWILK